MNGDEQVSDDEVSFEPIFSHKISDENRDFTLFALELQRKYS
jgi:hypothetical protein